MKQLQVTYRPLPFLRWQRTAKGAHPSRWEEVTAKQLLAIGALLKGVMTEIDFLHTMTNLKKRTIRKLDEYQRFKIAELLEFTKDRNPHNTFIVRRMLASGLPFTAPQPKLKGMPFGQFVFVDTLFGDYQEKRTEANLLKFMAALYIPEGETFSENLIDRNAPLMQKTKPAMREALVINYLLVKQWVMKSYPLLFVTEEKPEPSPQEPEPSKRDPMAWIKTFENLVGDDLVNENKYATLPVHTVLRYLSKKVKENMKKK